MALMIAAWSGVAHAQGATATRDAEARSVFEAGTVAFDDARYADALSYFQRAYELSERPALLYNIGVAADRLRQDEVALDAFERFLELVPDHPRRRDVLARVEVLRAAVARGESSAPPDAPEERAVEATVQPSPSAPAAGPDVGMIVGASALGAAGLAAIAVGLAGAIGGGECLDRVGDTCVEERATAWEATGLYLGLGGAALAGAVIWLVVALADGGGGESASALRLGPNGELTWTF